jgi:hypothetical protein
MSDFTRALIKFGIVAGVGGWCVIEVARWFFAHLSWSWGG